MSRLCDINILPLVETYHICHFVETGTGGGDGLVYASKIPFVSLWSCEIERSLLERAYSLVCHDSRINLFIGTSYQMLDTLATLPTNEPILFWLDAHFPGADYGLHAYHNESNIAIRLPLRDELALIKHHRPHNADVIMIDDARIWLNGPFTHGQLSAEFRAQCCPDELGISFIEEQFSATHLIEITYQQEGQIILTPKTA